MAPEYDVASAPVAWRNPRLTLIVVIPMVWFVAMGISRRGDATTVMAYSAAVLCGLILLTRSFDLRVLLPDGRKIAIGVAAAAVMIAGTYAGYAVIARFVPALKSATAALYGHLTGGRSSVAAAFVVTGVVIAEEIIWRGAFQSLVGLYVSGNVRQVVITSIVYAASLASFGSPLLVVTGLACGLFWSALRSRTSSVVPPLVAHVIWDVTIALLPLSA